MKEHDLRPDMTTGLKVEVDLSPFSAALIKEIAVQLKGTVLRLKAISSDCFFSEIQLQKFIERHEQRAEQNLTDFYLCSKIHFLKLSCF